MRAETPPLIAHIIYRLDVGGLENGLVNLINGMPATDYRHAIICTNGYSDFRARIHRPDVEIFSLDKREGKDLGIYFRLWRLLRRLRPAIVHTRNMATLELTVPAFFAGVPARIHGEHGRDMLDLDGSSARHRRLRRLFQPFVNRYIALSQDLARYLTESVGVPPAKVSQIYNGVDTDTFRPAPAGRDPLPVEGFAGPDSIVVGTVGRMQPVKDQLALVEAFIQLLGTLPGGRDQLRLIIVGDGPQRQRALDMLHGAGAGHLAWLPGSRADIPALLRCMDIFVLPSLGEGISNTILEAMASGLPVVASRVGGNPELVEEKGSGELFPAGDRAVLAEILQSLVNSAEKRRQYGQRGRQLAEQKFSMATMVAGYGAIYDELLGRHPGSAPHRAAQHNL